MTSIEKQRNEYRKKLLDFLRTSREQSVEINKNFDKIEDLPTRDLYEISTQIDTWRVLPEQTQPEIVKKTQVKNSIFKQISSTLIGSLGLPSADKFKSNAIQSLRQTIPNPGTVLSKVFNPRRPRDKADVFPENFYKINKSTTLREGDVSDLRQQDNGRSHLIIFHITNNDEILPFRMANFTGLTDAITPSFVEKRFFGRAEPYYQYTGVSRNVSFSFDVVVQNQEDVTRIYSKVNTLMSLAYPHKYTNNNLIEPNILRLSIGEYMYKKPIFLTGVQVVGGDETVFYDSKPSILTLSIQGNLLESEENPTYQSKRFGRHINNRANDNRPSFNRPSAIQRDDVLIDDEVTIDDSFAPFREPLIENPFGG